MTKPRRRWGGGGSATGLRRAPRCRMDASRAAAGAPQRLQARTGMAPLRRGLGLVLAVRDRGAAPQHGDGEGGRSRRSLGALPATIAAISPICPTMRGATLREGDRFLVVGRKSLARRSLVTEEKRRRGSGGSNASLGLWDCWPLSATTRGLPAHLEDPDCSGVAAATSGRRSQDGVKASPTESRTTGRGGARSGIPTSPWRGRCGTPGAVEAPSQLGRRGPSPVARMPPRGRP